MKSTFIKLQNESLPKDIGQELLIVNNSVLTCPIFSLPWVGDVNLWISETVARDLKVIHFSILMSSQRSVWKMTT